MNQAEALERIHSGDIPTQTFYHREKRLGYKWANRYLFGDGAILTASVVSQMLKARTVRLVVDGDVRRVQRAEVESCERE